MPRKPQVRYFASRGAYYCQVEGKQHKLATGPDDYPSGPTYTEAFAAFTSLLELTYVPVARDRSPVQAVLETYLIHLESARSASTLRLAKAAFVPFAAYMGNTPVGRVTADDLDRFIAHMKKPRPHKGKGKRTTKWGECSTRLFLKNLSAAMNWSVKRKIITANPVAGYEVPAPRNRTAACLITPADHARVLAACKVGNLRQIVVALHNTGARPGELIAAEARDWDDALGAIVYRGDDRRREDQFRHKTAGRLKDRVIYFTGDALVMMRELLAKHPTGPLLRGRYGKRWGQGVLNRRFRQLREKLGIPGLIPYGYRHTLATEWLESGRSIDLLAEVLGNTPDSIRRYYRHINAKSPAVLAALQEFRGVK